jgi:hypothetical protein
MIDALLLLAHKVEPDISRPQAIVAEVTARIERAAVADETSWKRSANRGTHSWTETLPTGQTVQFRIMDFE